MPDALLIVSFGGPEGPDEVMPFLERVVEGRDVPRARLEKVAEQYNVFGGVSPINAQTRALVAAIQPLVSVPVLWANRHAPPFLPDVLADAGRAGLEDVIAFATSAYAGGSSCLAYREAIEKARAAVGPSAPAVHKLPPFHDRAGFIAPLARGLSAALADLSDLADYGSKAAAVFSAHSVPANQVGVDDYVSQLRTTAGMVASAAGVSGRTDLVFQSRSGARAQPWLEPDINDHLAALASEGCRAVAVCPIGFTSDHMEVVFDLDTRAAATAREHGLVWRRCPTPGTDPEFVEMIAGDVNDLVAGRPGPPPCRGACCMP